MSKKTILLLGLLALCIVTCKKKEDKPDDTPSGYTPSCSGATPKFSSDVSPLIASSCAVSGCHAAGSANGPGALTTHAQISAAASGIRDAVVTGRMPKNGSLSDAQKNTIVCWIDAGAKND